MISKIDIQSTFSDSDPYFITGDLDFANFGYMFTNRL